MNEMDRRTFVAKTLGSLPVTGLTLLASARCHAAPDASQARPTIIAFTKSFQDRPIPDVCRMFKQIGLDGLDLTVRPGGHIDPKDVATELPKAVSAAKDAGVTIPLLTTAITDVDDTTRRILATAAEVGIHHIKMGYYRYREFGTLAAQIAAVRKRVAQVAKLGASFGVLPCIHIHSGKYIPSHGTLLYELIRDFSPQEIGAYVDPLHMAVEGGRDGWREGLDLLAPWIALSSIKNFDWERGKRDRQGQMRWTTRVVPVADGISPIPDFVAALKKLGYHGVYSLHSEYKGRHSFRDLTTDECLAQTEKDLKFLRSLLS